MHRMDVFVEQGKVNEAVNAIEMELVIDRDHEAEKYQPIRMLCKGSPRPNVIGIGPQAQHFISGPNGNARCECPDDIVNVLALEHEHIARLFRRELTVVFEMASLAALDVEAQLQKAVDCQNKSAIAREQIDNPAWSQGLQCLDAGREIEPR